MSTFMHALEVGFEIMHAIESVLVGGPGTVPFSWKGQKFTITVEKAS